jgi:hypothetical protein
VGGWVGAREYSRNFLVLRYEDLIADPFGNFSNAVRFLGIEVEEEMITRAIDLNTVDKMRAREDGMNTGFVRKGIPNSWRQELNSVGVRMISEKAGCIMRKFGYAVSD